MKERPNGIIDIEASIVCERESHKGIIIGKGGSMLKRIGMSLADALAPECIILSICKDCVCIHSFRENIPGSQPTEIIPI